MKLTKQQHKLITNIRKIKLEKQNKKSSKTKVASTEIISKNGVNQYIYLF